MLTNTLANMPIRRKVMAMLLLTSGVVLLFACLAFIANEYLTVRQTMLRNAQTLAQVLAINSSAALAFDNEDDARETLAALQGETHVVAAALYNEQGQLFATYPDNLVAAALPSKPGADGFFFQDEFLVGQQAVVQGNKRWGTLYLKSDQQLLYAQLRSYSVIAAAMTAVAFVIAYALSRVLQKQISGPVLNLAQTAEAVSRQHDYSVRARKSSDDEVGLLTDAFNQMLTQIQAQDREVRDSEARVRAVLNSALSAVIVMDNDGVIVDWNPRAERMFGWQRHEALGQQLAELIIPPQHRHAHQQGLQHYLQTGHGRILDKLIELTALRCDGSEFPVELSVNVLRSGDVIRFCGFVTDITERKREEKARAQLAAIVESSDDAIISKTLDGIITSWNPGAEKLFGYAASECVGKPMRLLFPTELLTEENEILQRMARGEAVTSHVDTVRLGKYGKRLDVSITISPIKNNAGQIIGVSNVVRDIAERKQTQTRIQAQLNRLDLLQRITRAIGERQDLDSIFQVVVRSLEDHMQLDFGCICLYDATAQSLTVARVGARSRGLAQQLGMIEQAHIPIDENGLSRCIRGQLVYEAELNDIPAAFPRRLSGCGLHAMVVAPLLAESKVFGVLVVARRAAGSFSSSDCEFLRQLSEHVALASHQAQLYTALQQAYDELRQSQHTILQQERLRALGQMASGVAHDINNAISPVSLYTESLLEREPGLSERARAYLTTIQRAIEDVALTVSRMREFYRPREQQLSLTHIDLNKLVQQVIELTRARWRDVPQERGIVIELRTNLAAQLPTVMGAENEIRDALTNLVFNAIDAMPEGGTLTLRTCTLRDAQQREVAVEVIDTGVGMDEQTQQRCLEPFYTTKGERGTGLGLAMVYGMVQRHSADLKINSAPGKGTTMQLIFPEAQLVAAGEQKLVHTRPPNRLRILLIDDDPLIIESLCDILESDGHQVLTAEGGQAGVAAFINARDNGERFDAVITDLGMPYMDGRRVAAAIKAATPDMPVVLLTGWGQRLLTENDIPEHVDRVLNKPPKLQDLRRALTELVASNVSITQPP
jgi:PAS domain S-box-containing protein